MTSPEEKEKLQHTYEENEKEHQKDTAYFLCRLIMEADKFDPPSQSKHPDQYRKLCAEVCRVIDYLPVDICGKLFTDEDLIELLRCRDYSHYNEMKQMSALEQRLSSGRNACLFIVSLNPYARKLRINSDCDFFRALKRCLEKGLTLRAYCCRYNFETGIIIDKSIPIMIEWFTP